MREEKKNTVVFATKESHCLGDLLIKHYSNELEANIKAVISNHNSLKDLVEKFEIPYHFISAENLDRKEQENQILNINLIIWFWQNICEFYLLILLGILKARL